MGGIFEKSKRLVWHFQNKNGLTFYFNFFWFRIELNLKLAEMVQGGGEVVVISNPQMK